MDAFFTSSSLLALVTLTFLEIVLGRRQRHLHFDSVEQTSRVTARPGSADWTPGGDGDAHPAFAFHCLDH